MGFLLGRVVCFGTMGPRIGGKGLMARGFVGYVEMKIETERGVNVRGWLRGCYAQREVTKGG